MNDAAEKRAQATRLCRRLDLAPIPAEGGYFRRSFTASDDIEAPARLGGGTRKVLSCIYFLLYDDFNAMHRMRTNEVWCHHSGGVLNLHLLDKNGTLITHRLGDPLAHPDNRPQAVAPADTWISAELEDPQDWALFTCVVAPGFEPTDYIFANRAEMIEKYPDHAALFLRVIRIKASGETDLDYTSPRLTGDGA
jgi:predicted cupin superfamily sugar epimerase